MRRGEIWWANLPPPLGSRPVLLISRDRAYKVRTDVTIAIVTKTIHGIPVEVPIGPQDGIREECVVNADTILTVPKRLLDRRITLLSDERMGEVERAIKFALDLD